MNKGSDLRTWGPRRRIAAAGLVAIALLPAVLFLSAVPASASTTPTNLTLSPNVNPTYWGAASVVVDVDATSGPNPTSGTVTISDSFDDLACTVNLSGTNVATCASPGTYTAVGSDTISATYGGTASFGSSANSTSVTVAQASTTLSLTAQPATVGETTTVTAQLNPSPQNHAGTLTITDSAGALDCSINTATSALTCTSATFTAVTSDAISASWSGNTDYLGATASSTLSVTQAATVVASVVASPAQVGGTATITVQVQPHPDGGNVDLTDAEGQVTGCGSLPVNTSTGQATCTTPTLTEADSADTLSATYLGDTNYAASGVTTGTLDIQRGTTQTAVTASPGPAAGSTATYIATITPSTAGAGGGSVDFSDTAGKVTDCTSQAVNTTSSAASCTSLAYTAVGSESVTGAFSGNANWAPSSSSSNFSVGQGSPNVSVTVAPSSPTVGETVTVTAVVSPSDGGGTVDFSGTYMGSSCSAVALSGNSASCTSQTLSSVGNWTLTATYSGDSNYSSAGTFKSVSVAQAPVTVAVGATTPSPYAFAADTIDATISPIPDGGTVTFSDSNGAISGCSGVGVNTTTGLASCAIPTLPGAGTYDVTATYSGDTNYSGNSGQLALLIAKIPTSISVSASPNPVTVGQTTALTVTVSPVPDGGSVTVTDGFGDLTCSGVAVATSGGGAGTASCTTRALSPGGTDSLAASFSGTSNYTSSSGTGSIAVNRIVSTTTVSSADSYGIVGQQLHVAVTVSPVPSNGTVVFSDALGQLGVCASVAVSSSTGVAACTSGSLTKTGPDLITATFQQTSTEASSTVSTTIPIDAQPAFTGSLTIAETTGSPSTAAIAVSGYPAPQVTAGASLPSGLTLTGSGSITGTPAFGSGGVYSIPITATNSLASANATATLVVGQAPAVTSPTQLAAAYGVESSFQVTTASGTYPPATFALSGATPAGMTFTDNGNGTGTISGTPTNYVSGAQSFSLIVTNAVGSVSVPFTIDVTGTPSPPTSGGGSGGGGSTTVTTTPTTTTVPSGTNGATLSPLEESLIVHKEQAVPSSGTQPKVTTTGSLPKTYDPIAKTHTVRKGKTKVTEPIVSLGPDSRFPTLGNNGPYGDCAVVADSNIVRIDHLLGKVTKVPSMTTNEALSEWSAINGGTGEGLTDSQFLHAWAGSAGLLGTRIRGWHLLSTTNLTAVKRAIAASGAIYAGIVLPSTGNGATTIDPALTNSTQVSGHGLALFGWTTSGFLGVSWGEIVLIPYSWWSQYSTTAYAVNVVQPQVKQATSTTKKAA